MNIPYIHVNIVAFLCSIMIFIAFFAAERSRVMNAWIIMLLDISIWTGAELFMRLDVLPTYKLWYYVSILAFFTFPYLVFNFVYQVADENRPLWRGAGLVGTIIILVISATGFILPPPEMIVNDVGETVFLYSSDWKVLIPTVFFAVIIFDIAKMIQTIYRKKGINTPGIKEIILGCILITVGNIAQIINGNTFPWDVLSALIFEIFILVSLYKKRMYSTSMLISGNVLTVVITALCALIGALVFPSLNDFLEKQNPEFLQPETEAFILLIVAIFVLVQCFRYLLNLIFRAQEQQDSRIKQYSDVISQTLSVDDILKETIKVIRAELNPKQLVICKRDDDCFAPKRSVLPLKPSDFSISADNPCVRYLQRGENHLVLKEFEYNPLYKLISKKDKELLQTNEIASICALKANGNIEGLVMLADKEKGKAYNYSDFYFLDTICSVASMALRNATLYEHVAEREHLFSEMTAYIPTVLLIKKKDIPEFCFISANTEEVLGLPYSFFASHSPQEALAVCIGREKAEKIIREFGASPESGYYFDIPFIRPDDNAEHTIRCAFSVITSAGRISHYIYALSDITADVEAQELLRSSMEIAQNSNKAKGEFMSHMSHEIRTPMNSIAGLTYLAKEHTEGSDDKELVSYLTQIDQSSHYMLNLLNNIMDMSKIENQLHEIRKEPFAIDKVIEDVCSVYRAQVQTKSINFNCNIKRFRNNNLIGDEVALQKILNNLLSNAYKFTPDGGEIKFLATQRYVAEKSVVMHFEVSDTGIGISEEFVNKIFEPYTQETASSTNNIQGSGLGLAICKNMVDMQGGTITASSNVGVGTKFSVDIPYVICRDHTKTEEKTALDFSVLAGKRILVVDDVAINTMITRKLLEKHGVIVDTAENGEEAVSKFHFNQNAYYDCILMDIQMPVMNGFEATAAIREINTTYAVSVPILAMTADAFMTDSGKASRNNFDGYIIKPVSPDSLYERLIQIFTERE